MEKSFREQAIEITNLFFRGQSAQERAQYAAALEKHKSTHPDKNHVIENLERVIRAVWAENPPKR